MLKISKDVKNIIDDIESPISDTIRWATSQYGSRIKYPHNDIKLSNTLGCIRFGKNEMRIGRFVTQLFKTINQHDYRDWIVTDKQIEDFVSAYQAIQTFNFDEKVYDVFVFNGEDIRKIYKLGGVGGTLKHSCMSEKPDEWFDIYTENENISIATVWSGEPFKSKLLARSILWDDCFQFNQLSYNRFKIKDDSRIKVMDRTYYTNEKSKLILEAWGRKKGYWKSESSDTFLVDGRKKFANLMVKLKRHHFENYPYLDTFRHYSRNQGVLMTRSNYLSTHTLESTGGSSTSWENFRKPNFVKRLLRRFNTWRSGIRNI